MAISAEFTADFSQYQDAARETTAALVELQTTSTAIDVSKQAQAAGTAIKELGSEVIGFASDFISSFAEEEAATKRLEVALRNTGVASAEVVTAYGEMATQFQTTTKFADDAITAAQTVFTQIGQVGPEQMGPAIQAAADLAEGLGIGIEEAAGIMAKALGSGGESLGALKKILGDNIEKGAGFEEIMGAINAQFGGQAAAAMDTTEGKLTALGNQWDDLKGRIGELLATALTPLLDGFMSLDPTLQTVIIGAGGLLVALTPIAMAIGAVVTAITPLIGLITGAGGLTAAFSALLPFLGPAGLIVAGITAVVLAFKHWDTITATVKAVYDGVKTWLVDGLKSLLAPITGTIEKIEGGFKWLYDQVIGRSYVPDLVDGIADQFGRLESVMVVPAQAAADVVVGVFSQAASTCMELGEAMFEVAEGVTLSAMQMQRGHHEAQRAIVDAYTAAGIPMNISNVGGAAALSSGIHPGYAPRYPNVNVTINGSVLSNRDEIARVVGDALTSSYSAGGNRLPV